MWGWVLGLAVWPLSSWAAATLVAAIIALRERLETPVPGLGDDLAGTDWWTLTPAAEPGGDDTGRLAAG